MCIMQAILPEESIAFDNTVTACFFSLLFVFRVISSSPRAGGGASGSEPHPLTNLTLYLHSCSFRRLTCRTRFNIAFKLFLSLARKDNNKDHLGSLKQITDYK